MRFPLRFERRWLHLLFRITPVVGFGLAAMQFLFQDSRRSPWFYLAQIACWLFVWAGWSLGYCEIQEDACSFGRAGGRM
jgi:hypothetical protein